MLMLQIQTEYTHWISAEFFEDWGQNLYEVESKIIIVKCLSDKQTLIWLILIVLSTVIYRTMASVLPDKVGWFFIKTFFILKL